MFDLLWQLFKSFFVIGLFNFGGGGAMLSLIQAEVVNKYGWLSEGDFTNIVAISQSTPGPIGINCATYVGYEVMGVAGSAVATFAVVFPSFLVFFLIIYLLNHYGKTRIWGSALTALKPAVAGLIGAAAFTLIFDIGINGGFHINILRENFPNWTSWLLFAGAFVLGYTKKLSPIALLLISAVIGLIFGII